MGSSEQLGRSRSLQAMAAPLACCFPSSLRASLVRNLYAVPMEKQRRTTGRSPKVSLKAVARTQAALAEAQRKADEAFRAARDDGYTFRDIADVAKCSHMTVRSRIAAYEDELKKADKGNA